MSKLTEAARGQQCKLQIHPFCESPNTDTVVFCHFPSNDSGIAMKSPDWWGADGCGSCHDVIDGRNYGAIMDLGRKEVNACMMRGLHRTLKDRIERGLITHV